MTTRIQSAADMALAFGGPPIEWTPSIEGETTAGTGQTYGSSNGAILIRLGNFCYVQGVLHLTNAGTGTGNALIKGVTYSDAGLVSDTPINIGDVYNLNLAAAGYSLSAFIIGDIIRPRVWDTLGGQTNLQMSELTNTSFLSFSGWYITDDPF